MKRVQSNKLDFSGQNIYVGIDVHLKSWSVAILSEYSALNWPVNYVPVRWKGYMFPRRVSSKFAL